MPTPSGRWWHPHRYPPGEWPAHQPLAAARCDARGRTGIHSVRFSSPGQKFVAQGKDRLSISRPWHRSRFQSASFGPPSRFLFRARHSGAIPGDEQRRPAASISVSIALPTSKRRNSADWASRLRLLAPCRAPVPRREPGRAAGSDADAVSTSRPDAKHRSKASRCRAGDRHAPLGIEIAPGTR